MAVSSATALEGQQQDAIARLIDKYRALPKRTRHAYQETEVRTNFIDPLFVALGWHMDDRDEVERETSLDEGKRPDYIFKLDAVPRFFLEAKPFRDDIYDETETRKAITKAYNRGVPWVGVTNFARFVLYDAQEELAESRPRPVFDLSCAEYLDPSLPAGLALLTAKALRERALETYAQRVGARRHGAPIEQSLYESMRNWREKLFNALYLVKHWNTDDGFREGDEAIQRLIDRLIFLRNCEDRGIAGTDLRSLRNQLRDRARHVSATQRLMRIFAKADGIYDSELFNAHATIDLLLPSMGTILDDTLAQIVEGLYAVPRSYSEYDFSQMEPDVLGEVYEQYLGFIPQRLRRLAAQPPLPGLPSREITITAKRQRRREHGIYYTPRWIVQYIVEQTLGRFLEENRNCPRAIDDVTILDPACGSGSFLIRAYETLLQHHAHRIAPNATQLDRSTREGIARRSIFGVDLDPQAVEIARLNLLIRIVRQQEPLPPLKDNIQHGNSLIEGDTETLRTFFGPTWEDKRPFQWSTAFPQVAERGGFDIIVGNPPYVQIQSIDPEEKPYYRTTYKTARGSYDLYVLFIERALDLLRPGGYLGLITSGKFLRTSYGAQCCKLIHQLSTVREIVDLDGCPVFEEATNYPTAFILEKSKPQTGSTFAYVPSRPLAQMPPSSKSIATARSAFGRQEMQTAIVRGYWPPPDADAQRVIDRLGTGSVPLADLADIFFGTHTGADDVFVLDRINLTGGLAVCRSRFTGNEHPIEPTLLVPIIKDSRRLRRWIIDTQGPYLLFPYETGTNRLIDQSTLASRFPRAWQYLSLPSVRARLGPYWHGYSNPKNHAMLASDKPRIVTRTLAPFASFAADLDPVFYFLDGAGGGYGIELRPGSRISVLFLLGLLNSRALDFALRHRSSPFRGGWWAYQKEYLKPLPIRIPDTESPAGRLTHDTITSRVQRMMVLTDRIEAEPGPTDYEREGLRRDIAATEEQIDALVYDLYGLTQEERAIVDAEVCR